MGRAQPDTTVPLVLKQALADRHLEPGGLVLYDVSSSWLEGRTCPLACYGHSRDGRRGKPQITYGLLTDAAGRPVAVNVFAGNTGDPTAFAPPWRRSPTGSGSTGWSWSATAA